MQVNCKIITQTFSCEHPSQFTDITSHFKWKYCSRQVVITQNHPLMLGFIPVKSNLLQKMCLQANTLHCFYVISGPDYIRQKYNEPVEVKEVPAEEKKEKSPSGSPHFYRKGTTPSQSPSQSPCHTPTPSPTAVKKSFFSAKTSANITPAKPAGKENKTPTAESLTAGK